LLFVEGGIKLLCFLANVEQAILSDKSPCFGVFYGHWGYFSMFVERGSMGFSYMYYGVKVRFACILREKNKKNWLFWLLLKVKPQFINEQ